MGEETRIPNKNIDNNKSKDVDEQNSNDNLDLSDLDTNDIDITNEGFHEILLIKSNALNHFSL